MAIIGVILLAVLYLGLLFLFFVYVAPYLIALGALVTTLVVLFYYVRAMNRNLFTGHGWHDSPTGTEPAFRNYFFRKGIYDYAEIAKSSFEDNKAVETKIFQWGGQILNPAAWPLAITVFLIGITSTIVGAGVYLFLGAAHLLVVGIFFAIVLVCALVFRLAETLNMAFRQIFVPCPHPGCYKKIALPLYHCPSCGVEHKKLVPGPYGVFLRRCKCGEELPTLFLFGRNRLPAFCPHCNGALSGDAGTLRNLHIAVIGGPSTGKTNFMMGCCFELERRGGLTVAEKANATALEQARERFDRGVALDKTVAHSLNAFEAKVTDVKGNQSLLYLYDAAGELFQAKTRMDSHHHFSYIHGLLLLVDPFSFEIVQADFAAELKQFETQIRPASDAPQETYSKTIRALKSFSKGSDLADVPVAVVVTKTDALGIGRQIETLVSQTPALPNIPPEEHRSNGIRDWLVQKGQGNLIRSLTGDFKHVCYFHCSAMGHMPGDGTSFRPHGVFQPFEWVLEQRNIKFAPAVRIAAR